MPAPVPLSLYVHLPWCVRKCPYCDFNSFEAAGFDEKRYVAALLADLEQSLPQVWGRRVQTVFMGGGTPSLFSPEAVNALLEGVRARLPLDPLAEITLEANPGTAEAERFAGYRQAGVNRLSLGVQSFDSRFLAALGRIHDGAEARRAAEWALAHFDNVNFDLIYALPGQTLREAAADARRAAELGASHVSAYHLTLEPGTAFYRNPPPVPDDDTAYAMQEAVADALGRAGFEHYETSAYACAGRQCRHNLNYWRFGDYLGIGAGAHGKLSFPDRIVRQERPRQPEVYMDKALAGQALSGEREIGAQDIGFEFMMNALRLTAGVEAALFEERTGLSLDALAEPLQRARELGLLEPERDALRPTPHGRDFLNELLQLFLQ